MWCKSLHTKHFYTSTLLFYFIYIFIFSACFHTCYILHGALEQKQFPPGINKVFWIWIWTSAACIMPPLTKFKFVSGLCKSKISSFVFMLMTMRYSICAMFWTIEKRTLPFLLNCTLAMYNRMSLNSVQLDVRTELCVIGFGSWRLQMSQQLSLLSPPSRIIVKICNYYL